MDITLPVSSDILIFGLINLNVLLVLLMLYLVLRNLAELFFESRQNVLGSKLKSKLVTSFISLSLIPTILLFFVSLQFVSTSMDYWFNSNIELSLRESLDLAKSILQEKKDEVDLLGQSVEEELQSLPDKQLTPATLEKSLSDILNRLSIRGPDSLTLITDQRNREITASTPCSPATSCRASAWRPWMRQRTAWSRISLSRSAMPETWSAASTGSSCPWPRNKKPFW